MGAEPLEVTPEMIDAGVATLREKEFGLSLSDIVHDIYCAMETARRYKSCASVSNLSK